MKRTAAIAGALGIVFAMMFAPNAVVARTAGVHAAKVKTVTICSSTPIGASSLFDDSKGIENGVALAIHWKAQALARAGLKVKYVPLDDGDPTTNSYSTSIEQNNALSCISKGGLGYVGTLNSGAAEVSLPILNKAHMVMISPANTNPGLTAPNNVNGFGGRKTEEPCSYAGRDKCKAKNKIKWVTYYRTVTTDAIQGPAGATFAHTKFHPKSYYLVDDELAYGVGLAQNFASKARKFGMKQLGHSHIDTSGGTGTEATSSAQISAEIVAANPSMVYCGCDEETSGALARDLRVAGFKKVWMGGDAFVTTAWFGTTTGAGTVGSPNSWATNVGPLPAKTGKTFLRLYKKYFKGFYKKPGIQAYDAPSFDAASIILTGIIDAQKAGMLKGSITAQRTAVVSFVHKIKFNGALGKTTFDKNGDTSNRIISIYFAQPKKGQWSFVKQFKAKGNPVG